MGEIDDGIPLAARQHALEAPRRARQGGRVRVVEIDGVGPGPAHSKIGRSKRRRQLAQARVCQVDGRPRLEHGRVGLQSGAARWSPVSRLPCVLRGLALLVRLPETAANHLGHFDIVGVISLVHCRDARHRGRRERDGLGHGGARVRKACHESSASDERRKAIAAVAPVRPTQETT